MSIAPKPLEPEGRRRQPRKYPARDELELQLVLRAQRGERATEDLIRRYQGFVRLRASAYFLAGGDSDDLFQEGLFGLYKAIRDYRPEKGSSFRSFVELCVTRQIITAIKTAIRHKHAPLNAYISFNHTVAGQDADTTLGDALPGPEAHDPLAIVSSIEELQALVGMLGSSLSPLEAGALQLYLEERSYEQMAVALDCDAKAIDNALQRVKHKIYAHQQRRDRDRPIASTESLPTRMDPLLIPPEWGLSHREVDVLCAIRAGYTMSEVAAEYEILEHTAREYRRKLCRKLGVTSHIELVGWVDSHLPRERNDAMAVQPHSERAAAPGGHLRKMTTQEFAGKSYGLLQKLKAGTAPGYRLLAKGSSAVLAEVVPWSAYLGPLPAEAMETVGLEELGSAVRVGEIVLTARKGTPTLIQGMASRIGDIYARDVESTGAERPLRLAPPPDPEDEADHNPPPPPAPTHDLLTSAELDAVLARLPKLSQARRRDFREEILKLEEQGGGVHDESGGAVNFLRRMLPSLEKGPPGFKFDIDDLAEIGLVELDRNSAAKRTYGVKLVHRLAPELIIQLREEIGDARTAPQPPPPAPPVPPVSPVSEPEPEPIPLIMPIVDHWALAEEYLARGDALLAESHEASAAIWIQAAQVHLGLAQRQAAAA